MITGQADPTLDPVRLERTVAGFRREVAAAPRWLFREKYVDRGPLDPFYILDYRAESELADAGDDLMGEPLFATALPGVTVKRMTREPEADSGGYWRPIEAGDLTYRLDRFLTMYREDYLQPPGYRGDLHDPSYQHPRFEKRKFVYRVGPSDSAVVGVGSRMFAGQGLFGAICGQLMDEVGQPLEGVEVVLATGTETLRRTSAAKGRFWFSRVAPGRVSLGVPGRNAGTQTRQTEEFGAARGWVATSDGRPLDGIEVTFEAPDAVIFRAASDASGEFNLGSLPAFSWISRVPDRVLRARICVVSGGVIGGVVRDEQGRALSGRTVVLVKDGVEVTQVVSEEDGTFRLEGLVAGDYRLKVPGRTVAVREAGGGTIRGTVAGAVVPGFLELLSNEARVAVARISEAGRFDLDPLVPGRYLLRFHEGLERGPDS